MTNLPSLVKNNSLKSKISQFLLADFFPPTIDILFFFKYNQHNQGCFIFLKLNLRSMLWQSHWQLKKGGFIYAYDGNKQLYVKGAPGNDELIGFTSSSVSIKKGNFIYTYDEKGKQIACQGVR